MHSLWLGAGVLALATCSARAVSAPPRALPAPSTTSSTRSTVVALLAHAIDASRTTDFDGTLIYTSGDLTEVLHVTHRFKNGEQDERIVTMTGAPRELLRTGDKLIWIVPRDSDARVEGVPTAKGLLADLHGPAITRLSKWYRFVAIHGERIAGRNCKGVAVEPRDDFRYGYRVWVDEETGLPLRVARIGADGKVLEQVMYAQITYPKTIPDSAFEPTLTPKRGYHVVHRDLAAQIPPIPPIKAPTRAEERALDAWHFRSLPPGFVVTLRGLGHVLGQSQGIDHFVISDGLSAVSVFATPTDAQHSGLIGLSQLGAVHAYGRALGKYHITAVGEVPGRTVEEIGNALQQRAGSGAAGTHLPAESSSTPAVH